MILVNVMGYSAKDIQTARSHIKNVAIADIFSKKGGANFTRLSGKDVEYIFGLYDAIFFQNQINEKVRSEGSEIRYRASERTSGAGGVCSIEHDKERCTYYVDIAPNILNTIFKRGTGLTSAAGIGCKNRVECLQLIVEHQIIHLLLILWDYHPLGGYDDEIYGPHGSLFQCMIKEYFGHTRFSHDLGIATIDLANKERSSVIKESPKNISSFGYAYWSNSCYLDSLMIVLLENISSFWRMNIMDADVDVVIYKRGICDTASGSKIYAQPDIRNHAKKIQKQIQTDYRELHSPAHSTHSVRCSLLRNLLLECLPMMKVRGRWVTFNVNAVYDVLAGLFPGLAMDVPIQIHRWNKNKNTWIPDPVKYQKFASATMWDYMDPLTNIEKGSDYKEIKWNLFQAHGIVFYNGGTPRIKNFRETGPEKGFNVIMGDKHYFSVNKVRAFGETIINGRYRLVGVVTLQGVSASEEGGTHYVAYFLGADGRWYYYDDLAARIVRINALPASGVWKEEGGKMPSMYFYQKIGS